MWCYSKCVFPPVFGRVLHLPEAGNDSVLLGGEEEPSPRASRGPPWAPPLNGEDRRIGLRRGLDSWKLLVLTTEWSSSLLLTQEMGNLCDGRATAFLANWCKTDPRGSVRICLVWELHENMKQLDWYTIYDNISGYKSIEILNHVYEKRTKQCLIFPL